MEKNPKRSGVAGGQTAQPGPVYLPERNPRVLMIVTAHGRIDADHPTGLWMEEFAVPWVEFSRKGFDVIVASPGPRRAHIPIDPKSRPAPDQAEAWREAREALRETEHLDRTWRANDFDALFICGGHGAMFDLPLNQALQELLTRFDEQGKPIAAVCHGPAAFVYAPGRDGRPLVADREVTAFTNEEEDEMGLTSRMPFLLESQLREQGGRFRKAPGWQPCVVRDGNLITGQNPASSEGVAREVMLALGVAVAG